MTREQVIKALECCLEHEDCNPWTYCANPCPYGVINNGNGKCFAGLMEDALAIIREQQEQLKAQKEVLDALRKVGYPHNFQREEPWIVNYMWAITDVVKKADCLSNKIIEPPCDEPPKEEDDDQRTGD